jgi:hypothetical protein
MARDQSGIGGPVPGMGGYDLRIRLISMSGMTELLEKIAANQPVQNIFLGLIFFIQQQSN